MNFTIDTWVLSSAMTSKNKTITKNAILFLKGIYEKKHKIVLDKYIGRILKEYKTRAKGYAKEWLIIMMRNAKKRFFKIDIRNKKLPKNVISDKYDKKFILVCLYTKDKLLVCGNGDRHYQEICCLSYAKKVGISILNLIDAISIL